MRRCNDSTRRYPPAAAATLMMLTVLLQACGPSGTAVERSLESGILHVGNGVEPVDLDPHVTTGISEIHIHMALFEGLVIPEPESFAAQPGVARAWKSDDEGRLWRFHLRPDARWSNGDPVTAGDFLFAWERILSPELGAANASMLFAVAGAESFHSGELTDFAQTGFRRIDDRTIEIRLEAPTPYFLTLVMHPAWFPLHEETLRAHEGERRRGSGWTRPGRHVGNGPFQLASWLVNDFVEVRRNPHYHSPDEIHLEGIRFYAIEDRSGEERAFHAGQLHKTYGLPAGSAPRYRADDHPAFRTDSYLGTEYYLFNTAKPPLDDPRVRRALSLALDRHALAKQVVASGQQPAYHFTPPGIAGYTPEARITEDADKARGLLAEAGFPDGRGLPDLQILFNTTDHNRRVAEAIQEMWRTTLGIRVGLYNQETRVYFDTRSRGDFTIARASWIGDYPDPNTFLELWTSWSGNNFSGWQNPDYDDHIRDAASTTGPDRLESFQQAERILIEQSPIAPLYFYVSAYLLHPTVQGWRPSPTNWRTYHGIRLEKKAGILNN